MRPVGVAQVQADELATLGEGSADCRLCLVAKGHPGIETPAPRTEIRLRIAARRRSAGQEELSARCNDEGTDGLGFEEHVLEIRHERLLAPVVARQGDVPATLVAMQVVRRACSGGAEFVLCLLGGDYEILAEGGAEDLARLHRQHLLGLPADAKAGTECLGEDTAARHRLKSVGIPAQGKEQDVGD